MHLIVNKWYIKEETSDNDDGRVEIAQVGCFNDGCNNQVHTNAQHDKSDWQRNLQLTDTYPCRISIASFKIKSI